MSEPCHSPQVPGGQVNLFSMLTDILTRKWTIFKPVEIPIHFHLKYVLNMISFKAFELNCQTII